MTTKATQSLEEIRSTLSQHKSLIEEKYKVTQLGIFGSYVKGEANQMSDVDILIDHSRGFTLFMLFELEDFLTGILGVKVDLVTKKGLKAGIKENILSEVIYV